MNRPAEAGRYKAGYKPSNLSVRSLLQLKGREMSRTSGVQDREAGLRAKVIFWLIRRRLGVVPPSARIQARDPKLLELSSRMTGHLAAPGVVSPKLKELAQLKVAAMVGCPF